MPVARVQIPYGVPAIEFRRSRNSVRDERSEERRSTTFHTEVEVRTSDSDPDFAGEHVHGRRGDRFIYLSWGLPDQAEPFVMFARAKIKLTHIPPELLERAPEHRQALRAEMQATNVKGQPAGGTIDPPAIKWSIA